MMTSAPPPRIAIYARYSSDLQNPCSVDDQIALCRKLIASQFPDASAPVLTFSDSAISGATMLRDGLDALIGAAKRGRVNLVVAEALDRLSRSQRDIIDIYEKFTHWGVSIFTSHEGMISELHVGLKGTMNALFLRDMKARVRRGQSAKIASGLSSSSCAYGYRVVRGEVDAKGRNLNGVREINEETAPVIRRVFQEFAEGRPILDIIADLNRDGIPAPAGGLWKRNTLLGSWKKQEGILRNELYAGVLVFNRSYVVRDPVSNKKRFVYNPEEKWTKVPVPDLRIIPADLWDAVRKRDRQRKLDALVKPDDQPPGMLKQRDVNSHNQHALTGYVRCGTCGGLKNVANDSRYLCSTHRYAKKCPNARGTRETVVREALFKALIDRVREGEDFRPVLLERFASELKELKALDDKEKDIQKRIERLMDAIERGLDDDLAMGRIAAHQRELSEIQQERAVRLQPRIPDENTIRQTFIQELTFLEHSDDVAEVRRVLRLLSPTIILTPIAGQRSGETIDITFKEEGWPEFWRLIQA